jgi:hypothetical protein
VTDEDHVRRATPGVCNPGARGHASARRRYLTPELREEAETLRTMIDKMVGKMADPKVKLRVKRIRQGASVRDSRRRNWQQQTLFHDDDE